MSSGEDRLAAINKAASAKKRPSTEKSIQLKCRDELNKLPKTVCHRYQGDQGGIKGHSDLYGTHWGRAFYIEIKRPDRTKSLSDIQANFLLIHENAGAITGVATSVAECKQILKEGME